jgi:thioredoxin reductase
LHANFAAIKFYDEILQSSIIVKVKMKKLYDVIIIGGSQAGLSAALVLGRSLRRVLIIDGQKPRNIAAAESHNFHTRDGENPLVFLEIAKHQIKKYKTVYFKDGIVSAINKTINHFEVQVDKENLFARKIILATGVKDNLPDIKGLKDIWGSHLFHCPYCHGWEVKDSKIALIINNKNNTDFVKLISHWLPDLIVFTNGIILKETELGNNKKIIKSNIDEVKIIDKENCEIIYGENRETFRGIFLKPEITFNNELAAAAGCAIGESGEVITDEYQQTSVEGFFAAGDLTVSHFHQRTVAAASGLKAGISVNSSLL